VGYIIHNMTSGSASNDGKPQGAISMGKWWKRIKFGVQFNQTNPYVYIYMHVHIHIASHSMRLHRTESCHYTTRHNITQHNTSHHTTPHHITSHHIHASHTCITCVHHTTHPPCFTLCIIYMYSRAHR
jgi:hypothetical protein